METDIAAFSVSERARENLAPDVIYSGNDEREVLYALKGTGVEKRTHPHAALTIRDVGEDGTTIHAIREHLLVVGSSRLRLS